jgi:hypothetical protein
MKKLFVMCLLLALSGITALGNGNTNKAVNNVVTNDAMNCVESGNRNRTNVSAANKNNCALNDNGRGAINLN